MTNIDKIELGFHNLFFLFSKVLSSNSAGYISKLMSVDGTEERILCF